MLKLGIWADLFIIAPVTANTLFKMVNGTSDNFLIATYLSANTCSIFCSSYGSRYVQASINSKRIQNPSILW